MVDEELYHPGVVVETCAIRRAFMHLINDTLTEFVTYWNSHRVRKSSDSPGGIPDVLFYTHPNAGAVVPDIKLTEAKASCQVSVTLTGDESVDEYFSHVVEQLQLQQP